MKKFSSSKLSRKQTTKILAGNFLGGQKPILKKEPTAEYCARINCSLCKDSPEGRAYCCECGR